MCKKEQYLQGGHLLIQNMSGTTKAKKQGGGHGFIHGMHKFFWLLFKVMNQHEIGRSSMETSVKY